MISDQALKEFKQIWSEEFGEIIPDEIALDEAINLLTMMNHTYRPIKKDWDKTLKTPKENKKYDVENTKQRKA